LTSKIRIMRIPFALIISIILNIYLFRAKYYYGMAYTRGAPYILGLLVGMLYKEYCQDKSKGVFSVIKTKFSKGHHIIITYVIGYGIILSIIFIPKDL